MDLDARSISVGISLILTNLSILSSQTYKESINLFGKGFTIFALGSPL